MDALTVKAISLDSNNQIIPADTVIRVDTVKMIGFFNGIHFDIFPDEFTLLN